MDSDGRDVRKLTRNADGDAYPAWSPDGRKIAFVRCGWDLQVVNAIGGGRRAILGSASSPSWSPDGRRLAVDYDESFGPRSIYVLRPDGGGIEKLTDGYSAIDTDPDWSRTGLIAFHRAFNGAPGTNGIYVMKADGSGARLVVAGGFGQSWSLGGTKLAFEYESETPSGIFVADADGTHVTRLTTGHDSAPAWSPDGSRIAFQRCQPVATTCEPMNVYVINTDGTGLRRLTPLHVPLCVVPRLLGKKAAAAKTALRSHACALGQVGHAYATRVPKGRVVRQRPRAGERLDYGAKVRIVLSLGRKR